MVIILMISAKVATPGLLKTTVFWNKGYDVVALYARNYKRIFLVSMNKILC